MKNGALLYLLISGVFLGGILDVLNNENSVVSLFQVLFISSFIVFCGYKIINDDFNIYHNNYAIILIIFFGLIFLSLVYSEDRMHGFFNGVRFLVLLLFVGVITNLVISRRQIVKGLILGGFICVSLSTLSVGESLFDPQTVIQNFLNQGTKITRSAAGGIYSDPNRFAASLFLPIAFGFSVMNSRLDMKYRLAGGFIFLAILGGIITSYSRSGFLSVVVICVISIYFFRKFKPFLVLGLVGLIIVLAIPSLRLTMFSYSERIIGLLSGVSDASSGIRVLLGLASIKMLIDSYGLGVGFDAFGNQFAYYYNTQETIGVIEPHNITYTIMAELGIQGLLIFSIIVFFLFRDAYNNIKESETSIDKIISVSLFSSFCGYVLFYQFYGGGLYDSILMLNIGLFLAHKKLLSGWTFSDMRKTA